jgi:hypothetical protein
MYKALQLHTGGEAESLLSVLLGDGYVVAEPAYCTFAAKYLSFCSLFTNVWLHHRDAD